uniref:phosphoenolpyruvate carboxykinase [GTP], mitochondrial-like n=1 Tax=Pristiophorus japonicus TaxID=55135 RepID=UPI00398E9C16
MSWAYSRILGWSSSSLRRVTSPSWCPAHRWAHSVPVLNGDLSRLPGGVRDFIDSSARLCQPQDIHICTGSTEENATIFALLEREGLVQRLAKYHNCWLARTDPRDVARVESKTVIVTERQCDTVPSPTDGGKSQLGNWMSGPDFEREVGRRFPGCMKEKVKVRFNGGVQNQEFSWIGWTETVPRGARVGNQGDTD